MRLKLMNVEIRTRKANKEIFIKFVPDEKGTLEVSESELQAFEHVSDTVHDVYILPLRLSKQVNKFLEEIPFEDEKGLTHLKKKIVAFTKKYLKEKKTEK